MPEVKAPREVGTPGRALRLKHGSHAMGFQHGQHPYEYFGRRRRITQRRVTPENLDAEASGHGLQAMVPHGRIEIFGQAQDAEGGAVECNRARRPAPGHESEVERGRVTDNNGIADESPQCCQALQNTGLPGHHEVGDAMNFYRARWNRPSRVDQAVEHRARTDLTIRNADAGHGHDFIAPRGVKTRRFQVDRHKVEIAQKPGGGAPS